MSSRGKWEDMVKGVLDRVAPVEKKTTVKQEPPKKEKKGLSVEDIPGDPGSTIGTIREHKKKQEKMLSDL